MVSVRVLFVCFFFWFLTNTKKVRTTFVEDQSKAKDAVEQLHVQSQIADQQTEIENSNTTDTAEHESVVATTKQRMIELNETMEGIQKQEEDLQVSVDKYLMQEPEEATALNLQVISELDTAKKLDLAHFLDE